ncbi:DUF5995 family protein [Tsukamurella sp. 8F]|uniref:DUF5995 family protein n=1 Tax=unclassified Tsukamurella TaxID=2633480 RepID=UPI0023B9D057|nr:MULTISPECIES: DUF5995 family protein [unclassified Tsukamurella]MDF0531361.1 DUF5995 family protein [Tsukamurella sp. 8J]MDF0588567.1 DUF5995 family protein [Tsukamurella sp. 8F]
MRIRSARCGLIALTIGIVVATGAAPPTHAAPSKYCGTPLSAAENARIAKFSNLHGTSSSPTFATLDDLTARQRDIADILAAHRDWRGLFAVGLDGVIKDAVSPVQRDESSLRSPRYAKTLSIDLVSRWLDAVHAQWTGGPLPQWWAHYFTLATHCNLPPARVAMAGYNAHITADLAYTVAAARSRPEDAHDFYRIVDNIARNGNVIPERTKRIYGGDLWGLWQFYFFGRGIDRVVGAGVASNLMLRAADDGYNTLTFANGLALQQPGSHPAVDGAITALWQTGEVAFDVLSGIGGLGTPRPAQTRAPAGAGAR